MNSYPTYSDNVAIVDSRNSICLNSRDFRRHTMEFTRSSWWTLFLNTSDKVKSTIIFNAFLKENDRIKLTGEVEYSDYPKLETLKARFTCLHTAPTWTELAYDVILTVQRSANALIFTGSIDETVDIFSNNVIGAKGGILSLSLMCNREDNILKTLNNSGHS